MQFWTKLRGGFLVGLGYMLSPLSWWNDLFFNLPIAYLFAYCFSWLIPGSFIPLAIAGYWLSNVLGFVFMQWGATDVFWSDRPRNLNRELWLSLGTSTLYTVGILALVQFHWLEIPTFLTESLPGSQ